MTTEKILVFVPMYNCAPQIPRVLAQLARGEVIRRIHGLVCIDNRSTDDTLEAARKGLAHIQLTDKVLLKNDDNYGLGGSHKVAIQYALDHDYTHLVVLHGDDQGSIDDLIFQIDAKDHRAYDCLLGARFMTGSRLQGYSFLRTAANHVFNIIFSLLAGRRLYDLGSGLNMYKTDIFRDGFHLKYADDLTFNYFLILGTCARGCSHRFFPLTWREDDQISNAKLFRQGVRMLKLIAHYLRSRADFLAAEHRACPRDSYPSTSIPLT